MDNLLNDSHSGLKQIWLIVVTIIYVIISVTFLIIYPIYWIYSKFGGAVLELRDYRDSLK